MTETKPEGPQVFVWNILIYMGLIPRSLLRLCHSRAGGNPGWDIFFGHPPSRV